MVFLAYFKPVDKLHFRLSFFSILRRLKVSLSIRSDTTRRCRIRLEEHHVNALQLRGVYREAFNAICEVTNQITRASWEKTVKQFHDTLVVRFDIEEAWAERQLKK